MKSKEDGETETEGNVKEINVKEIEKKLSTMSELKKLQFYGAGPKAAVPDIVNSGYCYYNYYFSITTLCLNKKFTLFIFLR